MRPSLRVLALVGDGLGAHGGIARYNQALLRALAGLDHIADVVVAARFGGSADSELPPRLRQLPAAPGKAAYVVRVLRTLGHRPRFDLVFCGHINMAPLAAAAARWLCCPWWLQIHGIDAWDAPGRLVQSAVAGADLVTAVSRHTRRRFLAWADLAPHRVRVLPDVLEPRFAPGPKPVRLLRRYGLEDRRLLLTVGRLSAAERYKGHDRMIAALPRLRQRFPDIAYAIAGDGDDRERLEALARSRGVAEAVRFLGRVPDDELVEHYRMADVFVMPSTKEGFGIVFLEAMACGLPAIGTDADGSIEPLFASPLGRAVPPAGLVDAIAAALDAPPRDDRPYGLAERFGTRPFAAQLGALTTAFAPLSPPIRRPMCPDLS